MPSPLGKALANILCYEFFLVTKIVCHPERSAKHGVEGSSYCRLLFRYISANRSFDSLRSLRMTTPLVLYQAYSSNSNLSS